MIFIVFFLLRCIQNRVRGISFFKYNVRRNSMTQIELPKGAQDDYRRQVLKTFRLKINVEEFCEIKSKN